MLKGQQSLVGKYFLDRNNECEELVVGEILLKDEGFYLVEQIRLESSVCQQLLVSIHDMIGVTFYDKACDVYREAFKDAPDGAV